MNTVALETLTTKGRENVQLRVFIEFSLGTTRDCHGDRLNGHALTPGVEESVRGRRSEGRRPERRRCSPDQSVYQLLSPEHMTPAPLALSHDYRLLYSESSTWCGVVWGGGRAGGARSSPEINTAAASHTAYRWGSLAGTTDPWTLVVRARAI